MKITDKVGILDPEGLNLNPLNGEEYSGSYNYFSDIWKSQPMYSNEKYPPLKIIRMIKNNKVIIIEAGTGQGKTVLIPKYCLHALCYEGRVIATNPKQIPTKKNAIFSAQCSDVEITKEIGYKYMGSKKDNGGRETSSESTKLLYATDGTLVEILRTDPSCSEFDIVIIDEAHERNMRIDNILLQMKTALTLNKKLKLVIMSATLPGNLFKNYYREFKMEYMSLPAIPNKPVEVHYLKEPFKNKSKIDDVCIDTLFNEIIGKKEGDVLIFTTSLRSALETCQKIRKRIEGMEKVQCFALTGKVKDKNTIELATRENDYKEVEGGPWNRKIVIGTNALESSITIEGLTYVIDGGTALVSRWDPERMEKQLTNSFVSQDAMKQRLGRVGRTKPGECWRMFTEKEYKEAPEYTDSDIKKGDITGEFLAKFSGEDINTVEEVKDLLELYIEPPGEEFVKSAIKTLAALKLITSEDDFAVLTEKGRKVEMMLKLTNYDILLATSLSTSIDYDCHFDMAALAAIIMVKDKERKELLFKPQEDKKRYEKIKNKFSHKGGDIFTYLAIYYFFYKNVKKMTAYYLKELCEENFIDYNMMREIRETHLTLWRNMAPYLQYKDNSLTKYDYYTNMIISFLSGYYINIARKKDNGKNFKNWFPTKKTFGGIDRNSFLKGDLEYIFYVELNCISGQRSFSNCNKITKKQLDIFCRKLGYEVSFPERRKTTKSVPLKKKKIKTKPKRKTIRLR